MSILEGNVSGSISGSLQLNGEGGTDNYNELDNKPQINGVTLTGNKNSEDLNIIADVKVNGVSAVDADMIADITIPPAPTIPVTDVKVNNQSAMVGTVAEITIPPTPTIPVTDVKVNNQSAMVGTVAEITIPPTPTIPVTDVQVNNASVVSGGVADIDIPVLDVTVDGESVVDANKVAALTTPDVPVQDVKVDGQSVVNAQGDAEITLPAVPVQDVTYNGLSVVDSDGIAAIPAPGYPVTDVELNGVSVLAGTIANIEPTAADVSYDNTASGYTATQTQDAIDEAAAVIADLDTNVGDFSTPLDTTAQDCHDAINELKQSLTSLSYPSNNVQIDTRTISDSTDVTFNFTPTHDGVLQIFFSNLGASQVQFVARIREAVTQRGCLFSGYIPPYMANEPLISMQCKANVSYGVLYRRVGNSGSIDLTVKNLY